MIAGRKPSSRPLARIGLSDALAQMPEAEREAGQQLRDADWWRVEDRGAGLWVAAGKELETELQLTGRKVKDYVCECSAFRQNELCEHLAALLAVVNLRKQPRAPVNKPMRRQSISTKQLVNRLNEHDLRKFVVDYARRNNDFALDLKVRFAQELPVADRFSRVITNLLKRTSATFGPKQAKRIHEALTQFQKQREEWLAEKAYLDLFELVTTLVPKLVVLIGKADRVNIDFGTYIERCISELEVIIASNPAPVILERIETWTDEQLEVGAYYRSDLDVALQNLKLALGSTTDQVRKQLVDANQRFGSSARRVAAIIASYYSDDLPEQAEALLLQHLHEPDIVRAALAREVERGNYRRAIRLAEAALEQQEDKEEQYQLASFLVAAGASAQASDTIAKHSPTVVLHNGSFDSVSEALEDLPDATYQAVLLQVLKQLPSSGLRPDERETLRVQAMLRQGDGPALEDMLYRSTNDSLIAAMLPRMVALLPAEDYKLLLETKVREHLDNRFGKQPAAYVAKLLDQVARRSRQDVTAGVVASLRKEYKQRVALMDALDSALL